MVIITIIIIIPTQKKFLESNYKQNIYIYIYIYLNLKPQKFEMCVD